MMKKIFDRLFRKRVNEVSCETRHKCLGLICPVSAYEQWNSKFKTIKYHADKPESKLVSANGIEFYVNTQWTAVSIQEIIQIAKEENWEVMIKL